MRTYFTGIASSCEVPAIIIETLDLWRRQLFIRELTPTPKAKTYKGMNVGKIPNELNFGQLITCDCIDQSRSN